MVCPRCGSDDIEVDIEEDGIPFFEQCFACGYHDHSIEYYKRAFKSTGKFGLVKLRCPKLRLHDK